MTFRVPGGPQTRNLGWTGNIFSSVHNLPARILNHSARGERVPLRFRSDGIAFANQATLPDTRHLSRLIFQNSSIRELTFKENISPSAQTTDRLSAFLATGDFYPIRELCREVEFLPPVGQMAKQGIPIIDLPVTLESIPGAYKHYTDYSGYLTILGEQMIRAQSYQERTAKVCLTRDSLSPGQALDRLFIGNPDYEGRGDFVLGFDLQPGLPLAAIPNARASEEWFMGGDLSLGHQASLRFAGANPLA